MANRQTAAGFQPMADAVGIANAGMVAMRIEQHNHHGMAGNGGLHHEALAGFIDKTRFRQADIPVALGHQGVGVVKSYGTSAQAHGY